MSKRTPAKKPAAKRARKKAPKADGFERAEVASGGDGKIGNTLDGALVFKTADSAGRIFYADKFPYVERSVQIGTDANRWFAFWQNAANVVMPRLTRWQRLRRWIAARERGIALCIIGAAIFIAGWGLSTIYSGLVVAAACRDTAAFKLLGQLYTCALGR